MLLVQPTSGTNWHQFRQTSLCARPAAGLGNVPALRDEARRAHGDVLLRPMLALFFWHCCVGGVFGDQTSVDFVERRRERRGGGTRGGGGSSRRSCSCISVSCRRCCRSARLPSLAQVLVERLAVLGLLEPLPVKLGILLLRVHRHTQAETGMQLPAVELVAEASAAAAPLCCDRPHRRLPPPRREGAVDVCALALGADVGGRALAAALGRMSRRRDEAVPLADVDDLASRSIRLSVN